MITQLEIEAAVRALREGRLVAFPTETVYGLGADACNDKAVADIFALKGRPSFNPLIVHVLSQHEAEYYAHFNTRALLLAKNFWPGPLTLVLPRKESGGISLLVSAGLDTVAIRVPAHPLAQKLLEAAALPIAAPSANRSGRISPTQALHVKEEFGVKAPLILDGGSCAVGLESTVIDVSGDMPVVLRPGSITREVLEEVLAEKVQFASAEQGISAPGMLASHYAPNLPIRLNATSMKNNEALLAFGAQVPPHAGKMLNLSASGDLTEAGAHLFAYMRMLDDCDAVGIAVMPIPEVGIGMAINDRLRRAAAPRD